MAPYPGIPYGVAPAWCFAAAEVCVFALFALCFMSALRRNRLGLPYLLGGLTFGVLLEYFEVVTDSYTYGHFHVMVGRAPHDLPLWIGAAWGIIMYTARLSSDGIGLPLFAAAALDTLLALNIDLSIDVVAYRLHMWHWAWEDASRALTEQWFGIPYGNFVGWATVVFCYAAFSRLFERLMSRHAGMGKAALVAGLAVLASLAVLVATETALFPVLNKLGVTSGYRLMLIVGALATSVVTGWAKGRGAAAPPVLAFWVPAWFHVYFVGCFFAFGFYRENPWMTAAALANLSLGVLLHLYPQRLRTSAPSLGSG